jgi:hypothetical protein
MGSFLKPTARKLFAALLSFSLVVTSLVSQPQPALAAGPTITITPVSAAAGASQTVPITISGFTNANLLAIVELPFSSGRGTLSVTTTTGLSFINQYNDFTDVTEVGFWGTRAAVTTALQSYIQWKAPQNGADANIKVTVSGYTDLNETNRSKLFFNQDNGHYYRVYRDSPQTFANARTAAAGRTMFGAPGYLVTVTSLGESEYIATHVLPPGDTGEYWTSGSDQTVEGKWVWMDGPEAGQEYWSGVANGSPTAGAYSTWNTGEPNDSADNEDGMEIQRYNSSNSAYRTQAWHPYRVKWNDISTGSTRWQIVEWGGVGNSTAETTSAFGSLFTSSKPAVTLPANTSTVTQSESSDTILNLSAQNIPSGVTNLDAVITINSPTGSGYSTLSLDSTAVAAATPLVGYPALSDTGKKAFGFSGTKAEVISILSAVKWTSGNPADRRQTETLSVSVSEKLPAGVFFNQANGHFYEVVSEAKINWDAAREKSSARKLFGLRGYLATITSEQENLFTKNNLTGQNIWIGGSDQADRINDALAVSRYKDNEAAEGNWWWVTGPEEERNLFFSRSLCSAGLQGLCWGDYNSWATGEPNNFGSGENHLVTNKGAQNGLWNDLDGSNDDAGAYLVEYGGFANEASEQIFAQANFSLVTAKAPVQCSATGALTQSDLEVRPNQGKSFYVDLKTNPKLDAAYVGYEVKNLGSNRPNLWVSVDSFNGGSISLANQGDKSVQLASLGSNQTKSAFFLLKASQATASAQTHVVRIFDGNPDAQTSTELFSCVYSFSGGVKETIKAAANKVTNISYNTLNPAVGEQLEVTITGETGVIGAGDAADGSIMWISPTAYSDFPTRSLRLESTSVTINKTGCQGPFENRILIDQSSSACGVNGSYIAKYSFRVLGASATPVRVAPVAYIASGTQYKHTDMSASESGLLTLNPPLKTKVSKNVDVSNVQLKTYSELIAAYPTAGFTPGVDYLEIGYSVLAEAPTSQADLRIDEIVDVPANGIIFKPGSANLVLINGGVSATPVQIVPISRSNDPGKLIFEGPFTLSATKQARVDYRAFVPNLPDQYSNQAFGGLGSDQIGSDADSISSTTTQITEPATPNSPATLNKVLTDLSAPPQATTTAATDVAVTSAVLRGLVANRGSVPVKFQYGTSPNLASFTEVTPTFTALENAVDSAASSLTGLTAATTYYYRLVALDGTNPSFGEIQSFTTLSASDPTLEITTTSISALNIGAVVNQNISVSSTNVTSANLRWNVVAGSLPTGLTLNSATGAITGTTSGIGAFEFTVEVSDGDTSEGCSTGCANISTYRTYQVSVTGATVTNAPSVWVTYFGPAQSTTVVFDDDYVFTKGTQANAGYNIAQFSDTPRTRVARAVTSADSGNYGVELLFCSERTPQISNPYIGTQAPSSCVTSGQYLEDTDYRLGNFASFGNFDAGSIIFAVNYVDSGTVVRHFTQAVEFRVRATDYLAPPENIQLYPMRDGVEVTFDPIPGATSCIVTATPTDGGAPVVAETTTTTAQLQLDPTKQYEIEVIAKNETSTSLSAEPPAGETAQALTSDSLNPSFGDPSTPGNFSTSGTATAIPGPNSTSYILQSGDVTRLTENGSVDTSFGSSDGFVGQTGTLELDVAGIAGTGATVLDIQVDENGNVFYLLRDSSGSLVVVKTNSSGVLDTNFGSGGKTVIAPPTGKTFDSDSPVRLETAPGGGVVLVSVLETSPGTTPTDFLVQTLGSDGQLGTPLVQALTNPDVLDVTITVTASGLQVSVVTANSTSGAVTTVSTPISTSNNSLVIGTPTSQVLPGQTIGTTPPQPVVPDSSQSLPGGGALVFGNTATQAVVIKYLSDGTLDSSFGTAGLAVIAGTTGAAIVDAYVASNGTIYLLMLIDGKPHLVAMNPNGSLSTGFGTGGLLELSVSNNQGTDATSLLGISITPTESERLLLLLSGTLSGGSKTFLSEFVPSFVFNSLPQATTSLIARGDSSSPAAPSYPTPLVTPVTTSMAPGSKMRLRVENISGLTQVEVMGVVVSFEIVGDQLVFDLPVALDAGVHNLVLHGPWGVLIVQSAFEVSGKVEATQNTGLWTRNRGNGTVAFVAKNIEGLGKVQFFVNRREIAWIRAQDASDPKLRLHALGGKYFVRTVELGPKKNAFEIYIDGKRVWRAAYSGDKFLN